jgi:hypothetical protein
MMDPMALLQMLRASGGARFGQGGIPSMPPWRWWDAWTCTYTRPKVAGFAKYGADA